MLPKTMIIVTSLLLAGSITHFAGAKSTGCGDSSYKGAYYPPYFAAPRPGYYYYFGTPSATTDGYVDTGVMSADGLPVLPLSEWQETNDIRGLQVGNCMNPTFQAGPDTRVDPVLP